MAMPWSRAKEKIRKYESGELDVRDLTRLFDACFRIQHEAIEARMAECPDCSGPEGWPNAPCRKCHIPLIVENVRGAQRWVGQAKWHFGSYYLWGDVPALMPITLTQQMKFKVDCSPQLWRDRVADSEYDATASGHLAMSQVKTVAHLNIRDGHSHTRHLTNQAEGVKNGGDWFGSGKDCSLQRRFSGTKQAGISGPRNNGKGDKWFQDGAATFGSKSNSRKAASAQIAKIPFPLAQHIARCFKPGAMW